jgi:hypothetical protein
MIVNTKNLDDDIRWHQLANQLKELNANVSVSFYFANQITISFPTPIIYINFYKDLKTRAYCFDETYGYRISFQEFFELIPLECKEVFIFYLDLFDEN